MSTSREKRLAVCLLSAELLADLLCLPAGARITGMSHEVRFLTDEYAFRIECECFEPVGEGQTAPTVHPLYRAGELSDGRRAVEFISWGFEDQHKGKS